jgi:hypothetical protein
MKCLILLLLSCAVLSSAADHNWIRRVGAIAVCAAGAYDTATTFHGAAIDPYATERTPFLRDAHMRPSPWRFALFEGGTCATAIWAARSRHLSQDAALSIQSAIATPAVIAGSMNLRIKTSK